MWQYQKLSTLFALGLVAVSTSTGCATSVEDPVVDEQEMSADNTAESSEALTTGGWGAGYGGYYRGYYGYGRGLGKFGYGYGDKFYGGYGGYGYLPGYAYGGYGGNNVNIIVEQDNVLPYGGYGDFLGDDWGAYGDYGDDWYGGFIGGYDDCEYGDFYGDDWN